MKALHRAASRWIVAVGFLIATANGAAAFTTNARRLAMGGVQIPGGREMASANVAYQTMPARGGGHGAAIPLPLGLLQLATDFPTLDPQDPDFSAVRLANLAINPPFFMEMSEPSRLDGDIAISIARNSFAIDFQDAQRLLPQKPLDTGGVYSRPLAGLGLLGARAYVAPVALLEGHIAFDDAMYGVLARGEPVLPNSTYEMAADGQTLGGMALNAGYSDGGWGRDNGDGLYAGAYAKYLLGFAFARAESRFGLVSGDTIFGDSDPLDVDYDATTRYAPFGRMGHGVGFDAGVAYRTGPIDVGVGVRDLGSRVRWSSTEVEHSYYDEVTQQEVTETLPSSPYSVQLPTTTTLNVAWTGTRTTLAADVTTNHWSTEFHAGAERRVGPLALRSGLLSDGEARLQYAWGLGLGLGPVWFDLGFQTHNRTLSGERGLTFGTSVALR